MDNQTFEKATQDIQLIKTIISRTSLSFVSFSRIFILWGILFIGIGIFEVIISFVPSFRPITTLPYLSLFLTVVTLAAAYAIYRSISSKTPVTGLSRQLMQTWVFIIVFQAVLSHLGNASEQLFHIPHYEYMFSNFSLFMFIYGFGLLCTSIFSGFKLPGYLSVVYMLVGLVFFLPSPLTSWDFLKNPTENAYGPIMAYSQLIASFLFPAALLILGGYLEAKKSRGA